VFIIGYDRCDRSGERVGCEWQDDCDIYDYDESSDIDKIGDDHLYGWRSQQDCDIECDEVVGMRFQGSGNEPH
jgi:hypothetical protein